ncbi:MAG: YfdX family protein [Acidihalobacter sp.]|jgi:hypothetical protein
MLTKTTFARVMLILLLGLAARASAAPSPSIQPDVTSLNQMQIYSALALADVEKARSALHNGSASGVANGLDKTRTMLSLLRSRMPAAEFHAMLSAVRSLMDFEDNKQVLPLFPKLFYALADVPKTPASAKARKALKKAENALRKPNRAGALHALDQADSAFTDPVLTPPLNAAEHDLTAAITALTQSSGKLTDAALKKLAGDLVNLHKALATYPLDMSPNAPMSRN